MHPTFNFPFIPIGTYDAGTLVNYTPPNASAAVAARVASVEARGYTVRLQHGVGPEAVGEDTVSPLERYAVCTVVIWVSFVCAL